MATYLPNVNRYVSKTKAFTPDFKFLSDSLDKRQDRYDTNYKKMNNLYGSVLHADLSRDDNREIRDEYVKALAPRLQQLSGVDFSLQQNVDAAKSIFTPFFEDEKTVRDIVFTKRYKSEIGKMESFRKSQDEDTRTKYWDGGIQMLNYSMDDFTKNTREESMNVRLPELVENVNLVKRGFEALKESGMTDQNVTISKDGHYRITQKNGVALTRRKSHRDPVTGEWVYYNPAQNFILETMLDDPLIHRYYNAKFYVEARQFYEANAEQYGGEQGAKKAFLEQTIAKYKKKIEGEKEDDDQVLSNATTGMSAWESYKAGKGDLIPGSDEMTTYERHLAEMTYLKEGQKKKQKRALEILGESTDMDDLMTKAGNAYASYFIDKDTRTAAARYADVNAETSIDEDQFALDNEKHKMNLVEDNNNHANKLNQIAFEKGYMPTADGMMPLPWAEGGPNQTREGVDVGIDFNDPNAVTAGDANQTGEYATDEVADIVAMNMETTDKGLSFIKNSRFDIVEQYYTRRAADISTADKNFSSEGMLVDGKMMTWQEAKAYYTTAGNGDKLKQLYMNILNIAKSDVDDVFGPDLQKSDEKLYNTIQNLENGITNKSTMLLTGWDEQTRVYNGVIEQLIATKQITMLQAQMLEAYPLFNSRGVMQSPEKIMEKMTNDFANYINDPKSSGLTETEAAENFGFYDVEDMNATIDGSNNGSKVSEKHFSNVYDEYWGKHDASQLFTEVKDLMNKNMQKASSIPGVQNFNLASHMSNQQQAGGGATIYNYHDSDYINGQVNNDANDQMKFINNLLKGPSANYHIKLGDQSKGTDGVQDPGALLSLEELIRDLKIAPGDHGAGKAPNFSIKWSERLGGQGEYSGWVITYKEDYASQHKTSNKTWNTNIVGNDNPLSENSITIFASTDYGRINPKSVENSYVSTTEFMVNLNKSRVINNDGAEIIFYRNSEDQMVYKAKKAHYNKETGNIEYGTWQDPEILKPSGNAIDNVYNDLLTQSQGWAKENHDAMEAHKKETNSK